MPNINKTNIPSPRGISKVHRRTYGDGEEGEHLAVQPYGLSELK
jgi:hypothetical protein